jgi:hypothetical protein
VANSAHLWVTFDICILRAANTSTLSRSNLDGGPCRSMVDLIMTFQENSVADGR